MTAFQRILINTEQRWNETVVTPSLAKPRELICTPNILTILDKCACLDDNTFALASVFLWVNGLARPLPHSHLILTSSIIVIYTIAAK